MTLQVLNEITCDDCGKCCGYVDTPPFRAEERASIPAGLAAEIRAAEVFLLANPVPGKLSGPCLWWDLGTKRCKNYDDRPAVCREFEMGGDLCVALRNWEGD